MSMGAVLHMTGKIKATDLGGLYKYMPFTAVCCIIGAASISAFPLFSGFISKSLTVAAVAQDHQTIIWLMLLFASAGVFHHAGIKVPYFVFFGHNSGIVTKEPPLNMRLAMGIAAFLCVFLGFYPAPLYHLLPFPVDYQPYTFFHVIGMLELLMFGALAFTILILSGFYPAELRAQNLDTDWFFRKSGTAFIHFCNHPLKKLRRALDEFVTTTAGNTRRIPGWAVIIENLFDRIFHGFSAALPQWIFTRIKPMNTESRVISWNLLYIISAFIFILFFVLVLST